MFLFIDLSWKYSIAAHWDDFQPFGNKKRSTGAIEVTSLGKMADKKLNIATAIFQNSHLLHSFNVSFFWIDRSLWDFSCWWQLEPGKGYKIFGHNHDRGGNVAKTKLNLICFAHFILPDSHSEWENN